MRNIIFRLFAALLVLVVFSCKEYDEYPTIGESYLHFKNSSEAAYFDTNTNNGNHEIFYGVTKPVTTSHTVELVFNATKSTAVLGTDFTIVKGTDVINSGESAGDFMIAVTKAAAIAGKKAVFQIKSATLALPDFKKELTVTFSTCPSNLGGTYAYSTKNYFSPDIGQVIPTPVTGTVALAESATTNGLYGPLADASFGAYPAMYGAGTTAQNVSLKDECGKLTFSGANQYGDIHSISNVVVNGSSLTFDWATSYGEYGTTTLTRTDGTNWPTNLH